MLHCKHTFFLLLNLFALIISGQETKNRSQSLRGNGLGFTQNRGQIVDINQQIRPDILYVGDGGGAKVYVRKTGISYVLSNASQIREVNSKVEMIGMDKHYDPTDVNKEKVKQDLYSKEVVSGYRIDLDFIGCNSNTTVEVADRVEGYKNYFYAHCPKGITNVFSYNELTVKNIYNKIDVRYSGDIAKGLKYDIIVNPGGDANDIQLQYSGMEKLYLSHERLYIKTSLGEIEESIPQVYQTINGQIKDIQTTYILKANRISFQIKEYNKNYPLIIDPWATYYGGSGIDGTHNTVCVDNSGNSLLFASTFSTNFPISTGVFQAAYAGSNDAFIAKFTPAGAQVFSTYFGGSDYEQLFGAAVDATNNIIICGSTSSPNLPVFDPGGGAYTQAYNGASSSDAFITKFNSSGTGLLWSAFYGGGAGEMGSNVAVDGSDNIIMSGQTWSTNVPLLNPYKSSHGGGLKDLFIVKFNSGGVRQWATYYGGDDEEVSYGLDCDVSGNVFIGGLTSSSNFPVISAFLSVKPTAIGTNSGFLAKLNAGTGFPVWSTYYGGSGHRTEIRSIVVDKSGNVVACGSPCSNNGIATAGTFQTTHAGPFSTSMEGEGFIVKFNNAGVRQWGTYLGGNNYEELRGIDCDDNNNVTVSGETYSANFPVTSCAFKTSIAGTENLFLTKLDSTGGLVCSTFFNASLGTEHYEIVTPVTNGGGEGCVAVSGCYAYITMTPAANDLPLTSGAFQSVNNGGGGDCALIQLDLNTCGLSSTSSLSFSGNQTTFCSAQPVNYTAVYTICATAASATYSWSFPGGTPPTSTLPNPTGIIYNTPGTYDVKLVVQTSCGKDSLTNLAYITVNPCGGVLSATTTKTDVNCNGANSGSATATAISGTANYTYTWSNGASSITSSPNCTIASLSANTYTVTITDGAANTVTATVTITEPTNAFTSTVTTTNATCAIGGSATAIVAGGNAGIYTYVWSNGVNSSSSSIQDVQNNLSANNYTVTIIDSKGCITISTASITGLATPTVTTTQQTQTICNNSNGVAIAVGSGGSGSYTYTWSNSETGATANNLSANAYTVTIIDNNGCTSTSTVTITNQNGVNVFTQTSTGTCAGKTDGSASVTISGGTGPYTYSWSNGTSSTTSSSNHSIISLSANTYTVTVTDNNSCTITATVTVNQFSSPIANAGADQLITTGTSIQLTASGGISYLWTPSATLNNAGINNPIANPTQTTTYTVTVTDANSCSSTDDIIITVTTAQTCNASEADEFVANIFTPNGDGRNDVLFVKGNGLTNIYFAIYNRWGQKLFETTDQTKGWDGTQNGKPIDEQTVVYYLKATCITTGENIIKKGDVSVVR